MTPCSSPRRYFRKFSDMGSGMEYDFHRYLLHYSIDWHTGNDYERAFSLYTVCCMPHTDFGHSFDYVCMETESNKRYIDGITREFAGMLTEVTGKAREEIERHLDRLLSAAHTPRTQPQSQSETPADCTLRPYQESMKKKIQEEWKHQKSILLQMPTGTGKTRLFVSLINDIQQTDPLARVLIITHRCELVEQACHTLASHYSLPHSVVGKRGWESSHILVASIQKLSAMATPPLADYLIIDEAHHSVSPSYRKLMDSYPSVRVLGVTATPCRLKPAPFSHIFGSLLLSQSVRQFINGGFLSDYRLFTVSDRDAAVVRINRLKRFGIDGDYKSDDLQAIVNTETGIAQLYEYYERMASGRRGIVYAVNRDHATRIAGLFRDKGVSAASVDCGTPAMERAETLRAFQKGSIKVLVNVELFTEGFDCPGVEFVMLARPTRSLAMYLQQVGRALRPLPGDSASKVVILDAVGLYNRFGLPERQRDWQAHFHGERPRGEDYAFRPLGTPGVTGIMAEITQSEASVHTVASYGNYIVCSYGDRLGVSYRDGRRVFPLDYHRITSPAGSWLVGERRMDGHKVYDILLPGERKSFTYSHFSDEGRGIYSAGLSDGRKLHFDSRLKLIPDKCFEAGGVILYCHGNDLYTLSLSLGSAIYGTLIRYASGVVRLTEFSTGATTLLCRGEVLHVPLQSVHNPKHFYSPDLRLHVYTDGTVFRRLCDCPVLYEATRGQGITLCNKYLRPLCQGDSLESYPNSCVVYKGGKPFHKVSYVDYLCTGRI